MNELSKVFKKYMVEQLIQSNLDYIQLFNYKYNKFLLYFSMQKNKHEINSFLKSDNLDLVKLDIMILKLCVIEEWNSYNFFIATPVKLSELNVILCEISKKINDLNHRIERMYKIIQYRDLHEASYTLKEIVRYHIKLEFFKMKYNFLVEELNKSDDLIIYKLLHNHKKTNIPIEIPIDFF